MNLRTLLLTALLSGTGASGLAANPLVPVESFATEALYSSPKLAPDGKHIAVNVRIMRNGRMIPTMSIYKLPELSLVSTIAMNGYEIPTGFSWITNTRLVVSKGLIVGAREMPQSTGELVAVDYDGKRQEYLFGRENFRYSSKGKWYGDDYGNGFLTGVFLPRTENVLVTTYIWGAERTMLYDINTANSSRKLVASIGARGLDFLVQKDRTPRFAFGMDDKAEPTMFRFDDASAEWRQVDRKPLGAWYRPFNFLIGDKEFYAYHSQDGGPVRIVRDAVDGSSRTVVAEDPLFNPGSIAFTAYPWTPFGVFGRRGKPTIRYLDESLADAQLHKSLSAQFPDEIVEFINFTDDGKKLLFHVASDRDPGSYYLYDRPTNKAELLFSNMDQIDPDQMAQRLPVEFKARDGTLISGFLTLPNNPGKKKLPMVLYPHGGPSGVTESWYFDTDAQFLASRGYAVLQLNFRGSGGRGENFMNAGQKQWGGLMIDDMVDGVKWAGTRPDIDIQRVCAYGISYGGYAALMLPVREPALFKCAVGYAGIYDLNRIYDEHTVKARRSSRSYYERWVGTDKAQLTRYSPALNADKIKIPVLLIHGGKDEIDPKEYAYHMRDALTKAGNPPDWLFESDEGHGFYDVENRRKVLVKLEEFFGKHIGKYAPVQKRHLLVHGNSKPCTKGRHAHACPFALPQRQFPLATPCKHAEIPPLIMTWHSFC
jgi:dipeptidyl aminopeptidase/acylaminoacyl peptidase